MSPDPTTRTTPTTPAINGIEPDTIRHLGDAIAGLSRANQVTRCGAVSDHCLAALAHIQKAVRAATLIGDFT